LRISELNFNDAFGIITDITDEQIKKFMKHIEQETYSTTIKEPIEYYIVEGNNCWGTQKMTKRKVVINPLPGQKACSLRLEAGNLSITAIYISSPTINRPLFPNKRSPTMTHTGCAGPGLEINFSSRNTPFSKFLNTYSIFYREKDSPNGGFWGYVIPDLVWGSHKDGGSYPHFGREFTIEHGNGVLIFKVDGVEGLPNTVINTYEQALTLKTYLSIAVNK